MSAYIVSRAHILYIARNALSPALTRPHGLSWYHGNQQHFLLEQSCSESASVANTLWQENVRSVQARYPNESANTLPGYSREVSTITPDEIEGKVPDQIDPPQLFKSLDCWEYQSCETDDFRESEAWAFVEALRDKIWHNLPGYDEAEWGPPKGYDEEERKPDTCRN